MYEVNAIVWERRQHLDRISYAGVQGVDDGLGGDAVRRGVLAELVGLVGSGALQPCSFSGRPSPEATALALGLTLRGRDSANLR